MNTVDYHLGLLQQGNQEGLRYFMQQHVRALTYFAHRIVKDTSVAEEIVQDGFVKVWEVRNRLESPNKLKSFLYVTTRNACLNHLETAYNRRHILVHELADDVPETGNDALMGMIHAETIALIHRELLRLPDQQATVFRLVYFEGLSTDEICQRLGITSNAVFLARSRAIKTLQHFFKGKDLLVYLAFLRIIIEL